MPRPPSRHVSVSVIVEHDAWRKAIADPLPLLRRATAAALDVVGKSRRKVLAASVAVALIDDRAILAKSRVWKSTVSVVG